MCWVRCDGVETIRGTATVRPVTRAFDAVLFDFSGVMTTSAFDAFETMGPTYGLSKDEMMEFLLGPYDHDTDHSWHRVERGETPIMDWVTDVANRASAAGFEFDFTAMSELFDGLVVHDQMVDQCRTLRDEGYRVALLTNNVAEGRDKWSAMLPLDELFHTVVDSSAVGMRKPDPAIYHLTLDRLGGVEPERAVFLDDHLGNVVGAQQAGLVGIHVVDPDIAIAELRALLD